MQVVYEQRKSTRMNVMNSVIIKSLTGEKLMGTSLNISAGGLMFSLPQAKEDFKIGDLIELVFEPSLFGPVNIKGEICHIVNKMIKGHQETYYGIKFLSIIQQLRRHLRYAPPLLTTIHFNDARNIDGLVEDINFRGLQIWVPEFVQPNSTLKLAFKNNASQFSLPGLCIYCHPVSEGNDEMFTIGVCYNDFDKKGFDQLRTVIFNNIN